MNLELTDFAVGLQKIMNKLDHPGLRPFVCDGSPLECEVFLVGKNPVSGLFGTTITVLIRRDSWQRINTVGCGRVKT